MNRKAQQAALANRILPGIQSFAWNADRSLVAVCPFSREILIFETNQKPNISDWRLTEVLREVRLQQIKEAATCFANQYLANTSRIF